VFNCNKYPIPNIESTFVHRCTKQYKISYNIIDVVGGEAVLYWCFGKKRVGSNWTTAHV